MKDIVINETGEKKGIKRLNEKKASGPDEIPAYSCSETVSSGVCIYFNENFPTITSQWWYSFGLERGKVVPVFKKGDRTKPENYRPVSPTAVITKVLEHIIVSQIMDHLDSQNFLHEYQHGFLMNHIYSWQRMMLQRN